MKKDRPPKLIFVSLKPFQCPTNPRYWCFWIKDEQEAKQILQELKNWLKEEKEETEK